VLLGPITEELFFRGYLTSHYEKQTSFTPILIVVLFSLYHFWLPFHNVFRVLAFGPAAYVAYKKKNLYISIYFHCLCNLYSTVSFVLAVLAWIPVCGENCAGRGISFFGTKLRAADVTCATEPAGEKDPPPLFFFAPFYAIIAASGYYID